MRKKRLFVVLSGFVLILAALACGSGRTEDIAATLDARPTATEIQWTPTVEPTPHSTLVPTSVSPPAKDEYLWELLLLLDRSVSNAEAFIELNMAASSDPSLFLDEAWQEDMAIVLAAYLQWGRDVRALDPPEEYLEVHAELLNVASHMDNFVSYYAGGVDNFDVDLIELALIEVELATEDMDRVNIELGIMTVMEANSVDG